MWFRFAFFLSSDPHCSDFTVVKVKSDWQYILGLYGCSRPCCVTPRHADGMLDRQAQEKDSHKLSLTACQLSLPRAASRVTSNVLRLFVPLGLIRQIMWKFAFSRKQPWCAGLSQLAPVVPRSINMPGLQSASVSQMHTCSSQTKKITSL